MQTGTHIYVYAYTQIHTYIYQHTHKHIHTPIYIQVYIHIHICIRHIHICNHYLRYSSATNFTICFSLSIVMFSSNTASYSSISYFKYNSFSYSHFPSKCSSVSCSFLYRGHRIFFKIFLYIFPKLFF